MEEQATLWNSNTGYNPLSAPAVPAILVSMNLSTNYTLLTVPLSGISVLIGSNSTNATTCDFTFNTSGLTSSRVILQPNNVTNTTTFTPTGLMEKHFSVYANCTYNINSTTNSFYLDTNSNPTASINFTTAYLTQSGQSFPLQITGNNWVEPFGCMFAINETGLSCVDTFCIQEYSNSSANGCGLSTGNYSITGSGSDGYVTTTYMRNNDMVPMYWQIRAGSSSARNITLNSSCITQNPLIVRLHSYSSGANAYTSGDCWDGSTWKSVFIDATSATGGSSGTSTGYNEPIDGSYSTSLFWSQPDGNWRLSSVSGSGNLYEEGIWWRKNTNLTNCTSSYSGERNYNVIVSCTGSIYNVSAGSYSFWIDPVAPTVTSSVFYGGNLSYHYDSIKGNFSWLDSNLYRLDVRVDGNLIYNVTEINSTTYSYNLNYNPSTLNAGTHTLNLTMFDAHTALSLAKDYKIQKPLLNEILMMDVEKNSITIEPSIKESLFNPFSYEVQRDRITFSYAPKTLTDTYSFHLKTDKPLVMVFYPNVIPYRWFVSGENWIDFYLPEEKEAKYAYQKVSDYEYIVTVSNIKNPKSLNFESVGELNRVTTIYNFTTYTAALSYLPIVSDGQVQSVTLTLVFNGSAIPTYAATHTYDGAPRAIVATTTGTTVVLNSTFYASNITGTLTTKYANWTVNQTSDNHTFSYTQIVSQVYMDTCGNYTNATAINITFYSNDYPTQKLVTSAEVDLQYYKSSSVLLNSSFKLSGDNSYRFCLYPEDEELTLNAYFKYLTSGGLTNRYYVRLQEISNNTLYLYAYQYNYTAGVSVVKNTVRDKTDYNYWAGVLTKLQRYYVDEGVWRVVAMDNSDEFGLTQFDATERTIDYRFLYYDELNRLIHTTSSLKFVCTSGVCSLETQISPVTATTAPKRLVIYDSWDNATQMLNITWYDATNLTTKVRVIVTKDYMINNATICDQSIASRNGTILCNTTGYTGEVMVRVYASASPEGSFWSKLVTIALKGTIGSVLNNRAEGALWSAGIIMITGMFGLAIGPIGVIVSTLFGVIVLSMLGLMAVWTTTAVIIVGIIAFVLAMRSRQ